ncbi:SPRY domain-containing SOCS box protein 3 isoform X2 [Euwallacea fornicatus]|uniref:SPRY domain-containing SOCS box protein 3 isoform X2 n=1 Tax=Euwallacea fornicatus TaxID=995702 RepID=UPI00338F74B7
MYLFVNARNIELQKISNTFCSKNCLTEAVDGKLQCTCGEEATAFDWRWQDQSSPNIRMCHEGREVLFHPVYSSGTAAVKGQIPFQQNFHYYWEIKIISKLYGTDVMVGVGTSKVDFEKWQFKFCSLLGIDSESWGYSYHGSVQHNRVRKKYGEQFGVGSIVGVHLDMCNGTLEYFLNRKSLGIAYRGLKGKDLYPMVCSTAAKSCIRVTCSVTKELTMQMMCLKLVMNNPSLYETYKNIPGLSRIFAKRYFWMQPQVSKDAEEKRKLAELDDDVTLSLVDDSYLGNRNKKLRIVHLFSVFDNEEEEQRRRFNEVFDCLEGQVQQELPDAPSTSGGSSSSSSSQDRPKSKLSSKKAFHFCLRPKGSNTSSDNDSDDEKRFKIL